MTRLRRTLKQIIQRLYSEYYEYHFAFVVFRGSSNENINAAVTNQL